MAGPYEDIEVVSYDGTDPDPVEWANEQIRPSVQNLGVRVTALEAAGGGSPKNLVGSPTHSVFAPVGAWVPTFNFAKAIQFATPNTTTRYAEPYFPGGPFDVDRVAVQVTTAGGAGSILRVGVYSSDSLGRRPQTLLADWGSFDTASTGIKELTISTHFDAYTLYWIVWGSEVSGATFTGREWQMKYPDTQARVLDGFTSAPTVLKMSGTGAWPTTWVDDGYESMSWYPVIGLRRSA